MDDDHPAFAAADPRLPKTEELSPDVAAAFEGLKNNPCRVSKLSIKGLKRTRTAVVHQELQRVLEAGTLEEIKDALVEAYTDLMGLGIFKAVDIAIDRGSKGMDTCDIIATFEESSVVHLHCGTYLQGTEGTAEVAIKVNNYLGCAEQGAFTVEYGVQRANVFSLSLVKPRPWSRPVVGEMRLHQLSHSYEQWSSFTELIRGGVATVTSEDGRHTLSYELGWRRLSDPSRMASRAVVAQLGDQLKSAAMYVFKTDTFDDPSFPMRGYGLRSQTEVAGLGLDVNLLRFFKQHVVGHVILPAWPGKAALHLTAEAGFIVPWGPKAATTVTSISDRFFVGGMGASSLRGFQQRGMGPSDARRPLRADNAEDAARTSESPQPSPRRNIGRDALGGDLFCTLLAALRFRLPHEGLDAAGVHGHVFVNGGNLVDLSGGGGRSPLNAWNQLTSGFRWSVGAGVEWATGMGGLEFNFVTKVLRTQQHDRIATGFQFGFRPPSF